MSGAGSPGAAVVDASGLSLAIVATRWHREITDALVARGTAAARGNDRAARFYEKCGWRRSAVIVSQLQTAAGVIPLEVWRYEKQLPGGGGAH